MDTLINLQMATYLIVKVELIVLLLIVMALGVLAIILLYRWGFKKEESVDTEDDLFDRLDEDLII